MLRTILTGIIGILMVSSAQARSFEEVKKTKVLKVGLRERDLVYAKDQKLLQTRVAELFAEQLGKKLGGPLKLELVVSKDMSNFWADDAGKVRPGEEYTPKFFKEVDVYTDVLTVNEWRKKLAEPIPFLPTKESFLCNFKASRLTFDKVKTDKIKLFTVKDSSFHTLIKKAGFTDEQLGFVKDIPLLIPEIESSKGKACAVVDSDFALFKAKTMKVNFAGPAVDTAQTLAWWVAKDDKEMTAAVKKFWLDFRKTDQWKTMFKEAYGMDFSEYLDIVGNL